jgi:hypothetical protein
MFKMDCLHNVVSLVKIHVSFQMTAPRICIHITASPLEAIVFTHYTNSV